MNQILRYMGGWLVRIFSIFVAFFLLQISTIAVSASPIVLKQNHHTAISGVYTYDEIESLISIEVGHTGGLSRVLSVKEVRPDHEVLGDVASTVAKTGVYSSRGLLNTSRQLQAKFKHAGDFSVTGNYCKANAVKLVLP